MLTQTQVKALFDYDPNSGGLWRKADGSQGIHAGRAGHETYKPDRNGVKQPKGRTVMINGKVYPETRIIWVWMTGTWSTAKFIDHADTNPFNNSWSNLREANDQESLRNRKPWASTGYKWVYEDRRGVKTRYKARIRIDGVDYHLGVFSTPQDAHAAALKHITSIHKQFTRPV